MRIPHVLVLAIALAGCGAIGSDTMDEAIRDALEEDQIHLAAAQSMTAMPVMLDELDRHTARMDALMAELDAGMSSRGCAGLAAMVDLRDDMRTEIAGHAQVMRSLELMEDARVEVEYHVGVMDEMLGSLDASLDQTHCQR